MMTKFYLCFLLFLLSNLFPISHFAAKPKPKPNHHHPPPPPPPTPPPPLPQHQLNNIIDALIGAGDFNNWANMLSTSDLFILPLSATLFVPSDNGLFPVPTSSTTTAAATHAFGFDPLIVPYHIVPQRLTLSQLTLFKPFSRLPTLLPSKSILITNTSRSNFTLDGSAVSYPDLYLTSAIAVHGIASVLNYTLYGGDDNGGPVLAKPMSPPPPPPQNFLPLGNGNVMGGGRRIGSDAGCLYGEFAFVSLLIPWVVCAIKIYGNRLAS